MILSIKFVYIRINKKPTPKEYHPNIGTSVFCYASAALVGYIIEIIKNYKDSFIVSMGYIYIYIFLCLSHLKEASRGCLYSE